MLSDVPDTWYLTKVVGVSCISPRGASLGNPSAAVSSSGPDAVMFTALGLLPDSLAAMAVVASTNMSCTGSATPALLTPESMASAKDADSSPRSNVTLSSGCTGA